ncbi:MAG: protein kinase, partial [Myxococcota bacterium]
EQLHRTRDRTRLADLALERAHLAELDGDPATGEVRVAEAVAAYDALGERRAAARALLVGARLRRDQGDARGAAEVLAGVLRRVDLDDPLCAGVVDLGFAEQELAEGGAPEALRLSRRALGRLAHGWLRARVEAWEVVALSHRALGDTDAAMVSLRRAAELLDEEGWPSDRPRIRAAHLQLQDARFDAARAAVEGLLARIPADAEPTRAAVAHALLLPPAVDCRDWTAFAHHLRRAATLADTTGRCHAFAAFAARQAGAMCDAIGERGSGPVARGVRAHSLAVNLFGRAAGLGHEVAHELRALAELRGRATPAPTERREPRGDERRGPIPAGAFDLLRPLGRGATGEVWRGRHHDRRWPVAVKLLAPELGSDPRFRLLLADEIRAMAALDHPNVVRVLGTGHLGPEAEVLEPATLRAGAPWFAMELAEAGTLEPLCGALPWTQCRAVMLALLDALAHAHARGVVHLDLKPANVLLRTLPDGRRSVLLTDFGLAGLLARAGGARIAGTPQYMAPEQFRGERRDLGPWTDLYAFGCLAYQLLGGAPPFSGDLDTLRARHTDARVPPLVARVSVPTGIDAWIERLLHKSPADRYQRAADAAWGLQRLPERFESLRLDLDPADVPLAVATVVLSIESAPADPRGTLLRLDGTGLLDAPPAPEEWRPLSPLRLDVDLAEAALALYALRRPPLVGREAERDRMWAVLRDVIETGVPRVVRVEGPSGSGKTALAQWLAERAHELGVATVLDGTPGPDGQLGIRALVLRHLRLDGLDEPSAATRVGALVPTLPTSVRADLAAIAADRGVGLPLAEQVGAVAAMVGATATARPVVVRLARGPTEEEGVLAQVLARVPAPVLVLLEGDADLGDVDLVRVTLGPMSDRDLAALLDARIPLASSLRARTIELAGGNPDLAVQLVADRIAADALVPVDGGYDLAPGSSLVLPQRVVRTYA